MSSKAKVKAKRSRAAKKLEECPGIDGPSVSGKRMKKLPTLWSEQAKSTRYKTAKPDPDMMEEMAIKDEVNKGMPDNLDRTFSLPDTAKRGKMTFQMIQKPK